ncbi:MAG: hypothetical protein RLZ98_2316 [Pseudomonadota bacterium]
MSENKMTFDELNDRLRQAPFHQWLGLELKELGEDGIVVASKWRQEFVVNAKAGYTHGGILATLIDTVADYALAAKLGGPVPTVDMRVDYHRPAKGDMTVKGRVIKLGRGVSSAEASVYDSDGNLVASGRGVYATAS